MKAIKTLFKEAKPKGIVLENQDPMHNNSNSNVRHQDAFSMYPDEASNKREQEYYNKVSGCSVRTQKK